MRKAGTNPHDLHRATGVPQPTIHRILTGESNDPRYQTIAPLADFFKVTPAALRDANFSIDEIEGLSDFPSSQQPNFVAGSTPDLTHIPKVKLRVSAASPGVEYEPDDKDGSTTTVPTSWVKRDKLSNSKLIAMLVNGESMVPTLFPDDIVVVNTEDTEPQDGGVYLVNYEGELVIRRLERDDGEWWLKADNIDQRKYGRKVWRGDNCVLVGRLVRRETNYI